MRGWLRNSLPPAGAPHEPGACHRRLRKDGEAHRTARAGMRLRRARKVYPGRQPPCGWDHERIIARGGRRSRIHLARCRARQSAPPCFSWNQCHLRNYRLVRTSPLDPRGDFRCGTALVYSPNFSIGVNVFFQTVARAASFFAKYPEYEAWGWEIHHSTKKDAPSGTLRNLRKKSAPPAMAALSRSRPIAPERIPVRTKLVLIPPATPSRCATRRAAVKALPAERCRPRAGSPASAVYSNFARSSVNWLDGSL